MMYENENCNYMCVEMLHSLSPPLKLKGAYLLKKLRSPLVNKFIFQIFVNSYLYP